MANRQLRNPGLTQRSGDPKIIENQVGAAIVDAAVKIHRALGPGLFETVYEVALAHELAKRGYSVERQVSVPFEYDGIKFEEGFERILFLRIK